MTPFNSKNYPKEIRNVGIALSTDHNPRYSMISPYWGGVSAVVEAMRNVAAVGATPHAVTDCLCFGNPEKPHQMWEFVEGTRGVSDACNAITLKDHKDHPTPIIAGNVSFYNESKNGSIPPSPIVSCLGRLKDVKNAIPMHFQSSGSDLLMVGERKDELGGSIYYQTHGVLGKNVPKPDLKESRGQIYAVTDCADKKLILSCHDISDGGIATSIAEMSFSNNIGCSAKITGQIESQKVLFSETGGFVMEVAKQNTKIVEDVFSQHGLPTFIIGETGGDKIQINNEINILVAEAKSKWENGLREKL
jgi:phosphoribosylformylglycinamidine synthase